MKIGILTFHSVTNYGAVLQCVGLYAFLRKHAPEAEIEIINYQPWTAVREYLRTGFYRNKDFAYFIKSARFSSFLRKNVQLSGMPVFKSKNLLRFSNRYDLIISGSDEIWRIGGIRGENYSYFLDFCGDKTVRAAYAPSVSEKTDITVHSTSMSAHLRNFTYLSVRDAYSKDIIERLTGRSVSEVLDPTFLHDFTDLVAKKPVVQKPFVLIYGQPDKASSKAIQEHARQGNRITVSVNKNLDWCDRSFPNASPSQWLWLYRNADTVFTQFYHGIIFALKNGKPFIALRHPGKKAKVNGLAEALGFMGSVLDGPLTIEDIRISLASINYENIRAEIGKREDISRSYLSTVLQGVNRVST